MSAREGMARSKARRLPPRTSSSKAEPRPPASRRRSALAQGAAGSELTGVNSGQGQAITLAGSPRISAMRGA